MPWTFVDCYRSMWYFTSMVARVGLGCNRDMRWPLSLIPGMCGLDGGQPMFSIGPPQPLTRPDCNWVFVYLLLWERQI